MHESFFPFRVSQLVSVPHQLKKDSLLCCWQGDTLHRLGGGSSNLRRMLWSINPSLKRDSDLQAGNQTPNTCILTNLCSALLWLDARCILSRSEQDTLAMLLKAKHKTF